MRAFIWTKSAAASTSKVRLMPSLSPIGPAVSGTFPPSKLRTMHLTIDELEAGLERVRQSPGDGGTLELIVRRPKENEREVLDEGSLDLAVGLVGDTWSIRRSKRTGAGPQPDRQLTLMNARAAALVAGSEERRQLAGDQLFVDLELSGANAPGGTRLQIGSAVVEITEPPHTGCV